MAIDITINVDAADTLKAFGELSTFHAFVLVAIVVIICFATYLHRTRNNRQKIKSFSEKLQKEEEEQKKHQNSLKK